MRFAALAVFLMSCSQSAASPAPPAADTAAPTDTAGPPGAVEVVATDFRNDKGKALISLYDRSKGFPDEGKAARAREAVTIESGQATVSFADLPPGTYAIAVLHDENQNFKMDTGAFGRPKEGYGASNDARGRFGPPKWSDAKFTVEGGARVRQTIRLVYP